MEMGEGMSKVRGELVRSIRIQAMVKHESLGQIIRNKVDE